MHIVIYIRSLKVRIGLNELKAQLDFEDFDVLFCYFSYLL